MSTEDHVVYLMQEGDGEEWMRPTPADDAVRDAVTGATDIEGDEIESLDSYIDTDELRVVLAGDAETLAFDLNDHEVTISSDGTVDVN